MWIILLVVLVLGIGLSVAVFLTKEFTRLEGIVRVSKGRKSARIALGVGIVALLAAALALKLNAVNAAVCLIHLTLFWALFRLAARFVRARRDVVCALATLATALYLFVGWTLAHEVAVKNYAVETDKAAGGARVVLLADAHIGSTFSGAEFAAYVDEMRAENPDFVAIAGDFVDDDTSLADMEAACAALGRFDVPVYFVFGNHDGGYFGGESRGYDINDLKNALAESGVTVLEDETVLWDDRIYIVGRKDASGARANVADLVAPLDPDKYVIALDHQPADFEGEAAAKIDLTLCGHTHGGQIIPINYVGEWIGVNDLRYGIETRGDATFVVTSGISDWALAFKTGCRSEYVVIDIQGAY